MSGIIILLIHLLAILMVLGLLCVIVVSKKARKAAIGALCVLVGVLLLGLYSKFFMGNYDFREFLWPCQPIAISTAVICFVVLYCHFNPVIIEKGVKQDEEKKDK